MFVVCLMPLFVFSLNVFILPFCRDKMTEEANNSASDYQCTLPPDLLQKAEKELNEKPEWRSRDIQALRDMVKKNKGEIHYIALLSIIVTYSQLFILRSTPWTFICNGIFHK